MNRVFENTSALLGAHLITRLLSLGVTYLLMTRYYGEKEMGIYFLAMYVTSLIVNGTELGVHVPLIREMTLRLDLARHLVGNALIIRILLSIVAFGLIIGVGRPVKLYAIHNADNQVAWLGGNIQLNCAVVPLCLSGIRADEI